MTTRYLYGLCIIAFLTGVCSGFDLVTDGAPAAVIITADKPVASVTRAAVEFADHIERASGVTLPVIAESAWDGKGSAVILGATVLGGTAGVVPDEVTYNGFVLKTAGQRLYIVGADPPGNWLRNDLEAGTLMGVYDYLTRHLHVRWLWPGDLGTVVPHTATIDSGTFDTTVAPAVAHTRWRQHSPPFSAGGWSSAATAETFYRDEAIWLRRHRFGASGGAINYGHAFVSTWDRFGADHPEFFNRLPDGQRRSDPTYYSGASHLVSMCVSEPNLHKQIVADWLDYRTKGLPYVNVNENDTSGKCTCPSCMAWDVPDPAVPDWDHRLDAAAAAFADGKSDWFTALGSMSDRYCRFYLAVLAEAQKHDPSATVAGLIYANYSSPPLNTRLNSHVILRFCPPIMYPWTDAKLARFQQFWDAWADTGVSLMMRPNFMLDGSNMPIFFAHKLGAAYRHAAARNMVSADYDSLTGQYAAQGPNLYMLARLQQYPDVSTHAVLDEFYSAFGPAKSAVKAYFAHLQAVSDAVTDEALESIKEGRPEGGSWSQFFVIAGDIFTPAVMDRAESLLTDATAAAVGDPVAAKRVAWLGKGLKNAKLTLTAQRAFSRYKKDNDITAFARVVSELDAYRASVEADHVSNMGENYWGENRVWKRSELGMFLIPGRTLAADWSFAFDPDETGVSNGWFSQAFDHSAWGTISTEQIWEKQPVGIAWAAAHDATPFDGIGWYRKTITLAPDQRSHKKYAIAFGAVDEACTVWFNGTKVLDRAFPYQGDHDSWRKSFEVDVTNLIDRDGANLIAVAVEDRAGAGGIWRPVRLLFRD